MTISSDMTKEELLSLLHRYMWHVGHEEGSTFIPNTYSLESYEMMFTEAEVKLLEAMDKESP